MKLTIDVLQKLQQKKYRLEYGYFIAEGEHLVQELIAAAQNNPALVEAQLFHSSRYTGGRGALQSHELSDAQMLKISDTKSPQGILAVVPIKALLANMPAPPMERVYYFHEVQDPGNLGTILRTLAWFGASRCLLSPASVDPFNSKVVRASMGAIFHVPIEIDVSLQDLSSRYPRLACLDMQGIELCAKGFAHYDAYVFGNEARGLPEGLNASAFTIKGSGRIESLNLASVVNICAYELARNQTAS